jgi:hypothetical protein
MHPDWEAERCTTVAYQLMTLVFGGWITLGSSRPLLKRRSRGALKPSLLDAVERLVA